MKSSILFATAFTTSSALALAEHDLARHHIELITENLFRRDEVLQNGLEDASQECLTEIDALSKDNQLQNAVQTLYSSVFSCAVVNGRTATVDFGSCPGAEQIKFACTAAGGETLSVLRMHEMPI